MNYITILEELTKEILSNELDYSKLKARLAEYKSMLLETSNLDLEDKKNRVYLASDSGYAIGTTWAAMCLDEIMRTRQFLRGVFKAVEDVRTQKNKPVSILYAGTGPFATLVLPLISRYSSDELKIIALEINEETIKYLKHIIKKLGIEDYFEKIICTNAVTYKVDKNLSIDILLSETMQNSLVREQQVPIMLNLVNQLNEDVVIIPQNIKIDLALQNSSTEFNFSGQLEKGLKILAPLMAFDKEYILAYLKENKSYTPNSQILLSQPINFKGYSKMDYNRLVTLTEIQVYKNEWLRLNQTSLTIPRTLLGLNTINQDKQNISVKYIMDSDPRLEYALS